jgi:hypothetical protein
MDLYSHPVYKAIEVFVAEWPNAEWGPGHIVLSDWNTDDDCIQSSLRRIASTLGESDPVDGEDVESCRENHPRDELLATREFLQKLLETPEDDRILRWE